MAKEVMERRAADNQYLHKDFHAALSFGLEYIEDRFGAGAVREYLQQFAAAYYAPLTADLKKRGLPALREYFEKIYKLEGGRIEVAMSRDELRLEVAACPAVEHMRKQGRPVARLWVETTKAVNETICEGTPYAAELVAYDPVTGHSIQRFYRRKS